MIAIRTDANKRIASGHLMRCLSIADALFSLGKETVFITSDGFSDDMLAKHGFSSVCLHSDWGNKEGELNSIIPVLNDLNPELLLIDSYQVTEHYLEALRKVVKIAYLDDLNAFDYPVDIIVNYSIYAYDLDYPQNKKYILGPTYAPLRKQFDITDDDLKKYIKERSTHKQILLTTGASDPFHVAVRIIQLILMEPELQHYRVICVKGRFWDDPEIIELSEKYSDCIQLLENVENMADIMLQSSIAVSAGGSTLYELCACCVPTVTFSYADNQYGNVRGFAQKGIMEYVGDVRDTENIDSRIVKTLLTYLNNDDIMDKAVNRMMKVDCRCGSEHLASELIRII